MKNILVINAGSSSVKLSIFDATKQNLTKIIHARALRLFHQDALITIYDKDKIVLVEKNLAEITVQVPNHKVAIEFFLGWLSQQPEINLQAVGHRVVHGGPKYSKPEVLTSEVMDDLVAYQPLAPLHQEHNLAPIGAIKELYADLLQIACFDTAFHQNMPQVAKRFALPGKYYEEGVMRYGFHGLSYEYILESLSVQQSLNNKKIVIAHLGNGASMCAAQNGKSIATTMSFTPLDGLVMGTRCGDLDPGVILHLLTHYELTSEEITELLYKKSGLLGVSGETNNMRKLLGSNTKTCIEAIDLFCYQITRFMGMLVAELGGVDQIVFTAGIGENSPEIRSKICKLASWLGIEIDAEANEKNINKISSPSSAVEVFVIPTNEALMIAKHTHRLMNNSK